jgi:hypothetical protein
MRYKKTQTNIVAQSLASAVPIRRVGGYLQRQ